MTLLDQLINAQPVKMDMDGTGHYRFANYAQFQIAKLALSTETQKHVPRVLILLKFSLDLYLVLNSPTVLIP